jgi:FtsZ-interacting cell division protein ZipA
LDIVPAVVIIVGAVLVIALIFVGFKWVKPESLRVSLKWNSLELELRREQSADRPRRTVKRQQQLER